MDDNSKAIITICSHIYENENIKPYKPSEWAKLADTLMMNKLKPSNLLLFSDSDFKNLLNYNTEEIERIKRLIERSENIIFEIKKYSDIGINIVTRADKDYPKILKSKLGRNCPPLFYYAGNIKLADKKFVGFTGTRNIDKNDFLFTRKTVNKIISKGYSIVSGGAKGIDTVSIETAINNEGICIEYISDSLIKKVKKKSVISAIKNNQLLIFSVINPDAKFTTGIAMMRNQYIYAHSEVAVVIKSNYKKGGTWNGALNSIKYKSCPILCWNNAEYTGNIELIKMGAFPIYNDWNGDISEYKIKKDKKNSAIKPNLAYRIQNNLLIL